MRLNFDGDRDSERRKDLTAEVTSTWRTCVGDGRVSVPPPLFEYDIVWQSSRWLVDVICKKYERTSGLDLARSGYGSQLIENGERGRWLIDAGLTSKVDVKKAMLDVVFVCWFVGLSSVSLLESV